MLSVEAAGNNGPPSGTNCLQVRREAQDFRRCNIKGVAFANPAHSLQSNEKSLYWQKCQLLWIRDLQTR